MKKIFLALGLVLALGSAGIAQTQDGGTPAVTPAATSLADIKFEKTTHDFGTLKQGSPCEVEFKYKNTGKEALIITNCQQSCGCTTPTCPKEPLLPGKTGVIKVKYDSNRVGPFTKTVTISSNAKSGNVVLTITGTIEAKPVEPTPAETTPAGNK